MSPSGTDFLRSKKQGGDNIYPKNNGSRSGSNQKTLFYFKMPNGDCKKVFRKSYGETLMVRGMFTVNAKCDN